MNRQDSATAEQVLGTLRLNGPMTTKEVESSSSLSYQSVYRVLYAAEKKNRVIGFRIGAGQQVLWSLNE